MFSDVLPVHESEDQFSGGISACNHSAVTRYAHLVQSYRSFIGAFAAPADSFVLGNS